MRSKPRYYADWLFRDLHGRKGPYVIAEPPNLPLIVSLVSIVLGIVWYPGLLQTIFLITAFLSFSYWSLLEIRDGRSRFRKLLGILGLVALAMILVWVIFF